MPIVLIAMRCNKLSFCPFNNNKVVIAPKQKKIKVFLSLIFFTGNRYCLLLIPQTLKFSYEVLIFNLIKGRHLHLIRLQVVEVPFVVQVYAFS